MKQYYLKITAVLCIALSLAACDSPGNTGKTTINLVRQKITRTVWERMASSFEFKSHHTNPRVQRFIKQYTRHGAVNLIKFSEQATPYVYHIVSMLEERGMPSELALLPIIESEYRPQATSHMGATGIWQFSSVTGRMYGLKQDHWYDGRRDVEAATVAALDYLQFLADKYKGDWLLALAAYNCGDGRVDQAIRKNKKLGKPTDYWSLSLPQETMYFVPKFLSLVYIIENTHALGINLAPIPNKPYFTKVKLNTHIGLHKAAELAQVNISEIKKLNPGFRADTTPPKGPHQILLPAPNVHIFKANYVSSNAKAKTATATVTKSKSTATKNVASKANKNPAVKNVATKATKNPLAKNVANTAAVSHTHTVHRGDTLVIIASKYKTTVKALMHKNNLKSDIIRSGQRLYI